MAYDGCVVCEAMTGVGAGSMDPAPTRYLFFLIQAISLLCLCHFLFTQNILLEYDTLEIFLGYNCFL